MFQGRTGYLKEVQRAVSNVNEWLMVQGCFKKVFRVSRDFQRSLKGVTFDVSRVFKGGF